MIEWLTACLLATATAVPADAAENHVPPSGVVTPAPDGSAAPDALLRTLRADAAMRSGLDAVRLVILPVEAVTWSDGSLGCPQPGLAYTQALEPGWRIRIEADAGVLTYHASQRGQWVLCPAGRALAPQGRASVTTGEVQVSK